MDILLELESGSSVRVRKAAEYIIKENVTGYCNHIQQALIKEIEKPKAWKTQSQLIKSLTVTDCKDSVIYLRELTLNEYKSSVIYRDLGMAIVILEDDINSNLDFFFEAVSKNNLQLVSGVCAGMLSKNLVPDTDSIREILSAVSTYTDNEGAIITPRCYIAKLAYIWPIDEVKGFLLECKDSRWPGLVEIASDSLQRKPSKIKLV